MIHVNIDCCQLYNSISIILAFPLSAALHRRRCFLFFYVIIAYNPILAFPLTFQPWVIVIVNLQTSIIANEHEIAPYLISLQIFRHYHEIILTFYNAQQYCIQNKRKYFYCANTRNILLFKHEILLHSIEFGMYTTSVSSALRLL
jgi:hypothetical protein